MSDQTDIWKQLVDCGRAYIPAFEAFFREGVDRVALVRRLCGDKAEIATALYVLPYMEVSERIRVFDKLVPLALSTGLGANVRGIIASLPRDWVLANIERVAEPLLLDADHIDYMMLLELYGLLDRNLAIKLARRAAAHSDADTREVGEDFLKRWTLLKGRKDPGDI